MPGIAGIIGLKPAESALERVRKMVGTMLHEQSYTSGSFADAKADVAVGWVAHANSYSDCHPIWNDAKDVGLIFSGEHYADDHHDASLKSQSNELLLQKATALVHLYEKHGREFFGQLNGTFSGLLIDRRLNKVFLFNDRFGLGRVYFHFGKEAFHFASEAKALLQLMPGLRRLDMRALGESLVCGCPLQDRTLFPDIALLPPGALWTFAPNQQVRKESYFTRASWEEQSELGVEEYYEELRSTLDRVIPRYSRGRQNSRFRSQEAWTAEW